MDREDRVGAPVVLTIAGLDPSGGAGIIADIRTFIAFRCIPTAAVTSLTFQNDRNIHGVVHQSGETVREQVFSIIAQHRVVAIKTGTLPTREIIREVARLIREENLPAPVVDPVLKSSSGVELMEEDAIEVLLNELMPHARVITPNIPEAERLSGVRIEDEEGMREAARKLRTMGARAVLIKGGHLPPGAQASCLLLNSARDAGKLPALPAAAIDVLDNEGRVTVFRGEWIDSPPVRGTGCILSSAIAACLAKGLKLEEAIDAAKSYVSGVIRRAERLTHNSSLIPHHS